MGELNRGLEGGDRVERAARLGLAPAGISPLAFLTASAAPRLYDLTYALDRIAAARRSAGAARTVDRRAAHPAHRHVERWHRAGLVADAARRAAGIVLGDHLDVIGHYESMDATFLRSGSHFDDARFRALWSEVAKSFTER